MSNIRVRKPPGGDSTFNIFGVPNEPKTVQKVDNSQKLAVQVEELQVKTDSTVTKEEKVEDNSEDSKQNGGQMEGGDEQTENVIQNSDETTSSSPTSDTKNCADKPSDNDENQNTPRGAQNKQRAGYNPITGEPYSNTEKTEPPKTTAVPTRVRQPPGGASSKLW